MLWIFCRIFCRSLCWGFAFLFSCSGPKCAFRGQEVQKERPWESPRSHFSEPFRPKTKTRSRFFSNRFRIHFLRLFCHFFWKFGDPQIPKSTLLELKRILVSWHFTCFSDWGPFSKKCVFRNFSDRKKSPREPPGGTPASLYR